MNLRDWLIIIGVVIIIGILLDGFRRMRLAKKDALKMKDLDREARREMSKKLWNIYQ